MGTATLLSAEDFELVAQVLGSCELVRGEIVPMSPGGILHSQVTMNAARLLDSHVRPLKIGRVLTGEAGVIVARRPDTVRGADVAFISYQRLPRGLSEHGFLKQPPELVIEVLSKDTSWTKMEEKVAGCVPTLAGKARSSCATPTRRPPIRTFLAFRSLSAPSSRSRRLALLCYLLSGGFRWKLAIRFNRLRLLTT